MVLSLPGGIATPLQGTCNVRAEAGKGQTFSRGREKWQWTTTG
ncbi:hypothetical protein [Asanoa siamensis]|nr:hypothetical protein [Asanoa siamensis]